jgi:hypothetical protein
MQRALESAIGLSRRPTSASWMLLFLIPADVRSNFIVALPRHATELRQILGSMLRTRRRAFLLLYYTEKRHLPKPVCPAGNTSLRRY